MRTAKHTHRCTRTLWLPVAMSLHARVSLSDASHTHRAMAAASAFDTAMFAPAGWGYDALGRRWMVVPALVYIAMTTAISAAQLLAPSLLCC